MVDHSYPMTFQDTWLPTKKSTNYCLPNELLLLLFTNKHNHFFIYVLQLHCTMMNNLKSKVGTVHVLK